VSAFLLGGRPGGGKTYYAVELGCKYIGKGAVFATTTPVKREAIREYVLQRYRFRMVDEQLIQLEPAQVPTFWEHVPMGSREVHNLVHLDEAHEYFSFADRGKDTRDAYNFFARHRHYRLDILFGTQRPKNLSSMVRGIIEQKVWVKDMRGVRSYGIPFPIPNQQLVIVNEYDPDKDTELDEIDRFLQSWDKRVWALYESWSHDDAKASFIVRNGLVQTGERVVVDTAQRACLLASVVSCGVNALLCWVL